MSGQSLHALLLPPAPHGPAACSTHWRRRWMAAVPRSSRLTPPLPPEPGSPKPCCTTFTPATVETEDGAIRWRPDNGNARPARATGVESALTARGGRDSHLRLDRGAQGSPAQRRGVAGLRTGQPGPDRRRARESAGSARCPPATSPGSPCWSGFLISGTTPVVVEAPAGPGAAQPGRVRLRLHLPGPSATAAHAGRQGAGLSAFRAILLGGAAIPSGLLAGARAAGARVITTYGMSETCGGCVYNHLPLDGVKLRTAPDGRNPDHQPPMLFSGYRNRPDLTGQALDDGGLVHHLGPGPPGRSARIRRPSLH